MFVIRIKIAKYDISVFFVLTFLNYSNYNTRSLDERARSRLYVLKKCRSGCLRIMGGVGPHTFPTLNKNDGS